MTAAALSLLALKMAIAAAIVVGTSVLAERSRPFLAAMLATLPISAGPSFVFLALDHPGEFVSTALLGGLVGNLATAAFAIVYTRVATRVATLPALAIALGGWLCINALLRQVEWSASLGIAVHVLAFAGGVFLTRGVATNRLTVAPPRAWYAIPLRALAVATLVASVTTLSWLVGPLISGMLAVFPIVLSSLIAILQPRIGGEATAALIANTLQGLIGFGLALWVASLAVPVLGKFWALGLGLAICILWNGMLLGLRRFMPQPSR